MSSAITTVRFKNGLTRYSIYYGSVDVIDCQTYLTQHEAWNNYKKYLLEPQCKHDVEKVELYADYGGGVTWDGQCCSKCGWMTDGVDPYYEDDETSVFGNWL